MAEIEDIIDLLQQIDISNFPEDYCNVIWDSNFTETDEITPETLHNILGSASNALEIFKTCSSLCRTHARKVSCDSEFWPQFAGISSDKRSILALLFCSIEFGQKEGSAFEWQLVSVQCADFYLSMLCIPGSRAYGFFHASLFEKAIDSLKFCSSVLFGCNGNDAGGRSAKNFVSTKKTRKRRGGVAFNGDYCDEEIDHSSLDGQEEIDYALIHALLANLLKTVWLFLGRFSLQNDRESIYRLICNLLDFLLTFDASNADTTECKASDADDNYALSLKHRDVVGMAFANLHRLLNGRHDAPIDVLRLIFKRMLPILILNSPGSQENISAYMVYAKDAALAFIHEILDKSDDKPAVKQLIYVLLQHICIKTSPRARKGESGRAGKNMATICNLAYFLDLDLRLKFVDWLFKLSRHAKATNRVTAVEVCSTLLLKAGNEEFSVKARQVLSSVVIKRCSDIVAAVRTRALNALCDLLQENFNLYLEILASNSLNENDPNAMDIETPSPESQRRSVRSSLTTTVHLTPNKNTVVSMSDADGRLNAAADENIGSLTALIIRRCSDDKAFVRKAAFEALELLANVRGIDKSITEEIFEVLHDACIDPTITVRKQGIQTLTSLLSNSDGINAKLEDAYLHCVLPCLLDRESTVQEKCVESVSKLIFDPLLGKQAFVDQAAATTPPPLHFRLLDAVERNRQHSRYLTRYLQKIAQEKSYAAKIVAGLRATLSRVDDGSGGDLSTRRDAAWLILAELSAFVDVTTDFASGVWHDEMERIAAGDSPTNRRRMLNYVTKILTNRIGSLRDPEIYRLFECLKHNLFAFVVDPLNIASLFNLLVKSAARLSLEHSDYKTFCSNLATECLQYLSRLVYSEASETLAYDQNTDQVVRRLATVGELVQVTRDFKDEKQLFYMLQALIVFRQQPDQRVASAATTDSQSTQQTQQPYDQINLSKIVDQRIKATAVSTLGKLCLRDEQSAKRCVDALALELTQPSPPAAASAGLDSAATSSVDDREMLRNNCVVVLCDLCVRYTSLVDRHVETLAACLRDPSQLVRKQTLTLLTSLLKEDYLKWRGMLFYRFLTSLLDSHAMIRTYVEFCFVNVLAERQPLMFFNHFLDSIYALNDAKRSKDEFLSSALQQTVQSNCLLGLAGSQNHQKRMQLYTFMLQRLTDQQRFQTLVRICQEILGNYADVLNQSKGTDVGSTSYEIIRDSLCILAHEDIKLTTLRQRSVGGGDADDDAELDAAAGGMKTPAAAAFAAARQMADLARKNLARAIKQAMVDYVVPSLVSFKHALEKSRSSLLRYLLFALRELCKDYKAEIDEIFTMDHQLAAEIAYDLKRYERIQSGRPSCAPTDAIVHLE